MRASLCSRHGCILVNVEVAECITSERLTETQCRSQSWQGQSVPHGEIVVEVSSDSELTVHLPRMQQGSVCIHHQQYANKSAELLKESSTWAHAVQSKCLSASKDAPLVG